MEGRGRGLIEVIIPACLKGLRKTTTILSLDSLSLNRFKPATRRM
jgi:hypothetical protein